MVVLVQIADQPHTVFGGHQTAFFAIHSHRDHNAVEQLEGLVDHHFMAEREGIERSREKGSAFHDGMF